MEVEVTQESGASQPTVTVYTTGDAQEYMYNVPDGKETNPEIIRAELLFYNTPFQQYAAPIVYDAIQNVQESCSADYAKFCGDDDVKTNIVNDITEMTSMLSALMSPTMRTFMYGRRLNTIEDAKKSGKHMVKYFQSFYRDPEVSLHQAILGPRRPLGALTKENLDKVQQMYQGDKKEEKEKKEVVKEKREELKEQAGVAKEKKLIDGPRSHAILGGRLNKSGKKLIDGIVNGNARRLREERPQNGPPNKRAGPPDQKGPPPDHKGPPPPPPKDGHAPPPPPYDNPFDHWEEGSESDGSEGDEDQDDASSDNGSEGSTEGDNEHHAHRWGHHGAMPEDTYFPGALGYGASGDMCLYKAIPNLSDNCKGSIQNLYTLRQAYWENYNHTQAAAHSHGHWFFWLIVGVLLSAVIRRFCWAKKRRELQTFFTSLNNNPELKREVEMKLNLAVPELCCGRSEESDRCFGTGAMGCIRKFLFTIFVLVASFFVGLFIAISSLEMTGALINAFDGMQENPDTGEKEVASPLAALLLVIFFVVLQTFLFVKIVKRLKKWYFRNFVDTVTPLEPSAPPIGGSPSSPSSPSSGNGGIMPTLTAWVTNLTTGRSNRRTYNGHSYVSMVSEDYVPLQDNGGNEMVVMGTNQPPRQSLVTNQPPPRVQIYTGIPIMPVTAAPVTSVNLV